MTENCTCSFCDRNSYFFGTFKKFCICSLLKVNGVNTYFTVDRVMLRVSQIICIVCLVFFGFFFTPSGQYGPVHFLEGLREEWSWVMGGGGNGIGGVDGGGGGRRH